MVVFRRRLVARRSAVMKGEDLSLDKNQREAVESIERSLENHASGAPLKIAILAQSHAAVDRVAKALMNADIPFIRVANKDDEIDQDVLEVWVQKEELLARARDEYQSGRPAVIIVLATIDGFRLDHNLRRMEMFDEFDLVVVEESGKATLTETLTAIKYALRVVLIGDHKQSRPHGIDQKAIAKVRKELGTSPEQQKRLDVLFRPTHLRHFKTSLFEQVFESQREGFELFHLDVNRRSLPWLVVNILKIIYPFIKPDPKKDTRRERDTLVLRDVKGVEDRLIDEDGKQSTSPRNLEEIRVTLKEMDRVFRQEQDGRPRFSPDQMNIITFYTDQVEAFWAALRVRARLYAPGEIVLDDTSAPQFQKDVELLIGIESRAHIWELVNQVWKGPRPQEAIRELQSIISPVVPFVPEGQRIMTLQDLEQNKNLVRTVKGFQGWENDVIFISFVVRNKQGRLGFVSELDHPNVASSRMHTQLVLVGDFSGTLTQARHKMRLEGLEADDLALEHERARETEQVRQFLTALYYLDKGEAFIHDMVTGLTAGDFYERFNDVLTDEAERRSLADDPGERTATLLAMDLSFGQIASHLPPPNNGNGNGPRGRPGNHRPRNGNSSAPSNHSSRTLTLAIAREALAEGQRTGNAEMIEIYGAIVLAIVRAIDEYSEANAQGPPVDENTVIAEVVNGQIKTYDLFDRLPFNIQRLILGHEKTHLKNPAITNEMEICRLQVAIAKTAGVKAAVVPKPADVERMRKTLRAAIWNRTSGDVAADEKQEYEVLATRLFHIVEPVVETFARTPFVLQREQKAVRKIVVSHLTALLDGYLEYWHECAADSDAEQHLAQQARAKILLMEHLETKRAWQQALVSYLKQYVSHRAYYPDYSRSEEWEDEFVYLTEWVEELPLHGYDEATVEAVRGQVTAGLERLAFGIQAYVHDQRRYREGDVVCLGVQALAGIVFDHLHEHQRTAENCVKQFSSFTADYVLDLAERTVAPPATHQEQARPISVTRVPSGSSPPLPSSHPPSFFPPL